MIDSTTYLIALAVGLLGLGGLFMLFADDESGVSPRVRAAAFVVGCCLWGAALFTIYRILS